ncbi:Uncharacterized protein YR821_p10023 (plasmid) [Yersinia ruckeri]|nr:Uncharacterized protein YR821_p10023 [Yersinia ruckeri]
MRVLRLPAAAAHECRSGRALNDHYVKESQFRQNVPITSSIDEITNEK